jgi:hypothetical protein
MKNFRPEDFLPTYVTESNDEKALSDLQIVGFGELKNADSLTDTEALCNNVIHRQQKVALRHPPWS